jgi:Ca2+-binding EF-hand superfamily protein
MAKVDSLGTERRMIRKLAVALAACGMLSACGSTPGEEPPVRGKINVFISPMGEPFRGGETDPYPLERWFARVDADHDGALSWDEFKADAEAFFRRLDTNHDGVLSGAEISAYEQDVAPEILPRVARLTSRDIPPLPSTDPAVNRDREEREAALNGQETRPRAGLLAGAGVFGVTPEPEPVAASDTDFDGKVTSQEWLQSARRRFDLLDLNHDGRIARAELPKTPAEKMADKAARRDRDKAHSGQ